VLFPGETLELMKTHKKKILIAEGTSEGFAKILSDPKSASFDIETTTSGKECVEKLLLFKPDLVLVDLMLPEVHGIEILKAAKKNPSVGVILSCYHGMIQNYRCAEKLLANYFLDKPYTPSHFFSLVDLFFQGQLRLNPFFEKRQAVSVKPSSFFNRPQEGFYMQFWGTRGSNPVAGMEYVRFGGNTPSLELRYGKDLVIIDAGSGIRALGQELAAHPNTDLHILLSHTHWDHLLGFPFFLPLYQPRRNINIYSPVGFEKSTEELFSNMLGYAYFPVSIKDIRSNLVFKDLRDSETYTFGRIKISTHYAFHPGSTLCFKIEAGGQKIGYVTDNEFLFGCHLHPLQIEKQPELFIPYASLIKFLEGCDILVHEAQYTEEEYDGKEGWGHSSIYNACALIKKTNIKHWIVVHHDPRHTDAMLLEKEKTHIKVLEEIGHPCTVQFAYDGMMLPLDH